MRKHFAGLLDREPVRLIGYGAAGVVALVVLGLGTRFDTGPYGVWLTALAVLVIVVEGMRHFVYCPQTYIEDLSDEWAEGHGEAHLEHELREKIMAAIVARREAQKAAESEPESVTRFVPIARASDSVN